MLRSTACLAILLLFAGCRTHAPSPATTRQDAQAAIEAIQAQGRRFSQAYVDGDVETLVSIYAEDGVAAPGGRDFIRGREALRRYWQIPEGRDVTHHRSTAVEIVVAGDYAYDWGYYEGASGPVGDPRPFEGKYVIVWRRDADGVWRMVQDMWNGMPAPDDEP